MSTAELNLQSWLWRMLVHKRSSGWPVSELMANCRAVIDDEELASYFAPGADDLFRHFVRERSCYFYYDAERDTVTMAEDSPSAAMDTLLVRYLALWIQAADEGLDIGSEALARSALPECMADHLITMYGGSLEIFFRAHPRDFTIQESGTLVWMTLNFRRRNTAACLREHNLVLFFVDLLQKIGVTKDNPCDVHTLRKYLPFMKTDERNVLDVGYRGNLNVFFLLYPSNFATTAAGNGCVFLRNYDPHYGQALFLKQLVQIECRRTSGLSPKVSVVELTLRAKYSSSPVAPCFTGARSAVDRVRYIARRHPAIFLVDLRADEVWLRQEHPPWPEGRWNAEAEYLAVAYFIDILKHIDATSPSRAICFNYIVQTASAAPPNCRDYLESVFPALEVIGLFHMHPGIFDLPSVNRVCLKTMQEAPSSEAAPEDTGTEAGRDNAAEQAVCYVAKLLKYARDLNPELLGVCVETAPLSVRNYCMASVDGRLQSLIESGRAALSAQETQLLSLVPPIVCAKTTSEASTQTGDEPAREPVKCEPEKEDEVTMVNRNTAEAEGHKAEKESAVASLFKAIAAHEVSGLRLLPKSAKSIAAVKMISEKGKLSSGLSETGNAAGKLSQGAVLFAALERLAKMPPETLDSELGQVTS
uniref:Uncharacterized protein n=1 Tax=Amblyomma aureolatum TaxID=187763 RepID=A0A1E1XCH6_9ACAR